MEAASQFWLEHQPNNRLRVRLPTVRCWISTGTWMGDLSERMHKFGTNGEGKSRGHLTNEVDLKRPLKHRV